MWLLSKWEWIIGCRLFCNWNADWLVYYLFVLHVTLCWCFLQTYYCCNYVISSNCVPKGIQKNYVMFVESYFKAAMRKKYIVSFSVCITSLMFWNNHYTGLIFPFITPQTKQHHVLLMVWIKQFLVTPFILFTLVTKLYCTIWCLLIFFLNKLHWRKHFFSRLPLANMFCNQSRFFIHYDKTG